MTFRVRTGQKIVLLTAVSLGVFNLAMPDYLKGILKETIINACHKVEDIIDPSVVVKETKDGKVVERFVKIDLSDALIAGVSKDIRSEVIGIEERFYNKEVGRTFADSQYDIVRKANEMMTKRVTDETIYANAMLGYDYTPIMGSKSFKNNFVVADNLEKVITILVPPLQVLNVDIDYSKTKSNNGFKDGEGILTDKDGDYEKKINQLRQKDTEEKVKNKFEQNNFSDNVEKQKIENSKKAAEEQAEAQYKALLCNGQYEGYSIELKTISDEDVEIYINEALYANVAKQISQIKSKKMTS